MGPISEVKGPFKEVALAPDVNADPIDADNIEIFNDNPIIAYVRGPRAHVANWAMMRSQGLCTREIAEKIGITHTYLKSLLWRATKEGWLKFTDPEARLEHEIKPIIIDNIKHFLLAKDRTMTIESAKGVGFFKSHQAVKVEGNAPQTILALKIEALPSPAQIVEGNIVGQPRELKE